MSYNSPNIDRLLGLTAPLSCDYAENIKCPASKFVYETMSVIAIPESEWSSSRDDPTKPLHLKEGRLKDTMRGLYKFVCSRLMPIGHQSDVIWPRAVLICTILTGD